MPNNPGYGTYSLSNGLLTTGTQLGGEAVGFSGTGIFTQTGGSNLTAALSLGGQLNGQCCKPTWVIATPGTYNLSGGLFQTGVIDVGSVGNNAYAAGLPPSTSPAGRCRPPQAQLARTEYERADHGVRPPACASLT